MQSNPNGGPMSEMTATHKEKLMTDLKLVIADAEELMKLTAGGSGASKQVETAGRLLSGASGVIELGLAGSTGLEPAASGVTGRRSNQLNYDPELNGRYRTRTCDSRRVKPVLYQLS